MLSLALGASVFLVACGDNEEATNLPDNTPTEQNNMNETTTNADVANLAFNFTHFDLDIKYADNISYEVDYENEASRAEATIDDEVNKSKVEGNEATNILVPIFESFTFDATTDSDAVIDEVLQKFNQPANYLEFELEIQFADGTVKEYYRTQ